MTSRKQMNFHFTIEFSRCLDLSLDLLARLLSSDCVQFKWKYGKLAAVAQILQNAQNLVISRCFSAEYAYEMQRYKDVALSTP